MVISEIFHVNTPLLGQYLIFCLRFPEVIDEDMTVCCSNYSQGIIHVHAIHSFRHIHSRGGVLLASIPVLQCFVPTPSSNALNFIDVADGFDRGSMLKKTSGLIVVTQMNILVHSSSAHQWPEASTWLSRHTQQKRLSFHPECIQEEKLLEPWLGLKGKLPHSKQHIEPVHHEKCLLWG